MDAGELNKRITILRPKQTTNSIGQRIETSPSNLGDVWAANYALTAKDVSRQAGIAEQAEAKFLIRYRSGITTKMQVRYKGELYQITGTEDYERGVGLFLFVRRAS